MYLSNEHQLKSLCLEPLFGLPVFGDCSELLNVKSGENPGEMRLDSAAKLFSIYQPAWVRRSVYAGLSSSQES